MAKDSQPAQAGQLPLQGFGLWLQRAGIAALGWWLIPLVFGPATTSGLPGGADPVGWIWNCKYLQLEQTLTACFRKAFLSAAGGFSGRGG